MSAALQLVSVLLVTGALVGLIWYGFTIRERGDDDDREW
jgi:hypothetical protein